MALQFIPLGSEMVLRRKPMERLRFLVLLRLPQDRVHVVKAEHILTYVSRTAGDALNPTINHGEYFFAPNNVQLRNIFEIIAQNIATKISQ